MLGALMFYSANAGGAGKPANRRWVTPLKDFVTGVALSPDNTTVAATTADGQLTLIDAATGAIRHAIAAHKGGALAVSISRDSRRVATGGEDGKARIRDATSGAELAQLEGGAAWVEHVAFDPASDLLATGAGKLAKVWRASGTLDYVFPAHRSTISHITWHTNSRLLVSCYGGAHLWHIGRETPTSYEFAGSILVSAFSPDGKYLASGCQNSSVHCWVVKTGNDLEMSGYSQKVREISWDPTSRWLATGGGADAICWDFSGKGPQGSKPLEFSAHGAPISDLAFARTVPILATGGEDAVLCFWSPSKGANPLRMVTNPSAVSKLVWSADESFVVCGCVGGEVVAWNAPTT